MDLMDPLFISLGAAVIIYYGVKVLLFTRMLFPKFWFPLPQSFFSSMGEWAGELYVHYRYKTGLIELLNVFF